MTYPANFRVARHEPSHPAGATIVSHHRSSSGPGDGARLIHNALYTAHLRAEYARLHAAHTRPRSLADDRGRLRGLPVGGVC